MNQFKHFLLIILIISLSSCGIQANIFKADITSTENILQNIQAPKVEINKTEIKLKLSLGVSFISLPYLKEEDSNILEKTKGIINVWQEDKNKRIYQVNSKNSYYVETDQEVNISFERADESDYNSLILNIGQSFPSLYKGTDTLLISDLKINNTQIKDIDKISTIIEHFYIINNHGYYIDIINEKTSTDEILFGGGVMIEPKSFLKLSWPLSDKMVALKNEEEEKIIKEEEKLLEKKEKEKEQYVKKTQTQMEKLADEASSEIFLSVRYIPIDIIKGIKEQKSSSIDSLIANRLLLAQVHSIDDITKYSNVLSSKYWLQKKELDRPFRVLENKEFEKINTSNRAIVFIEFPYTKDEIDTENGIEFFFRGISFIRNKDCSWLFDPIETQKLEENIIKNSNIYSEKHLIEAINNFNISLSENEDFTKNRIQCKPDIEIKRKGKFIDLDENKIIKKKKLPTILKNHEKECENFSKKINNFSSSLLDFVFDNEEEELKGKNLNKGLFPKIAFYEDICKFKWYTILEQENLKDIINGEDKDGNEINSPYTSWIVDDSFYMFLGSRKYKCDDIDNPTNKDLCQFGLAISKDYINACINISSNTLKHYCTGHIAQSKKTFSTCETVFGKYDEKKDKKNFEKKLNLNNCQLNILSITAKSKNDCKIFKKRFLFFFSLSTPTYKYCLDVINGDKKFQTIKPTMSEEDVLNEMGIEEENYENNSESKSDQKAESDSESKSNSESESIPKSDQKSSSKSKQDVKIDQNKDKDKDQDSEAESDSKSKQDIKIDPNQYLDSESE